MKGTEGNARPNGGATATVHPNVGGYAADGTPKEPGGTEERGGEQAPEKRAVMGDPERIVTGYGGLECPDVRLW